jgi:hypothetical protein
MTLGAAPPPHARVQLPFLWRALARVAGWFTDILHPRAWAGVAMLRRNALVFITVLSPDAYNQVALSLLLLMVAFMAQLLVAPYKWPAYNLLEASTLAALISTQVVGLLRLRAVDAAGAAGHVGAAQAALLGGDEQLAAGSVLEVWYLSDTAALGLLFAVNGAVLACLLLHAYLAADLDASRDQLDRVPSCLLGCCCCGRRVAAAQPSQQAAPGPSSTVAAATPGHAQWQFARSGALPRPSLGKSPGPLAPPPPYAASPGVTSLYSRPSHLSVVLGPPPRLAANSAASPPGSP